MDETEFWAILGKLDWKKAGDEEKVLGPAVRELAKRPATDIAAFDDMLCAKLFALDAEVYAREIGTNAFTRRGEYFAADEFLYARCFVVAKGSELYQRVLTDPRQMPKDAAFEALLDLAAMAYERSHDDDYAHVPSPNAETFSNDAGWPRVD